MSSKLSDCLARFEGLKPDIAATEISTYTTFHDDDNRFCALQSTCAYLHTELRTVK